MIFPILNKKEVELKDTQSKNHFSEEHLIWIRESSKNEMVKAPPRYDLINFLLEILNKAETNYLEIGVRNPADNFDKVKASHKYGVDPGLSFIQNPVQFKVTSDEFFRKLSNGEYLSPDMRFDVIFIDGLHIASQVQRDIDNCLQWLDEDGFIVLHDCNPPTEFHARELYEYLYTPAGDLWNGTTWKAFVQFRKRSDYFSCCIDSDWGIGVINKKIDLGPVNNIENPFFEFETFKTYRKESLNLCSFEEFKSKFQQRTN